MFWGNTSLRPGAVAFAGLGLCLIGLVLLMLTKGIGLSPAAKEPSESESRVGAPRAPRARDALREEVVLASAGDSFDVHLTVVDVSGAPILGATVARVSTGCVPVEQLVVIATTDSSGCATVGASNASASALSIGSSRHYPRVITNPQPGATRVVLHERSHVQFVVTTPSGIPVAGLRADVCQGSISGDDVRAASRSGIMVGSSGQVISTNWSDATGLLQLDVPRGRLFVLFNSDEKPWIVLDLESVATIEAPFSGRIVVTKPLAAVLSLVGDETLAAHTFGKTGVAPGGSHIAARARAAARSKLEAEFPGCIVVSEVPYKESVAGTMVFRGFGVTSGWHERVLPLVEYDKILSPTIVELAPGGSRRTAIVRFAVTDPAGDAYSIGKGDIVVATRDVGDGTSFEIDPSNEVELPSGTCSVRPSGVGLPLDFEEIRDISLLPGEQKVIEVRLRHAMRPCSLRIRWDDGTLVPRGSISYWDERGAKRTRLIGSESVIKGWVVGSTIGYSVTAGGHRRVDGVLTVDSLKRRLDIQDLVVVLPKN